MSKNLVGSAKIAQAFPSTPPRGIRGWLDGRLHWVATVGLVAAVFACYSRSLGFQFILDDHRFAADPRIQDPGHLWDYFTTFVWAQFTGATPSFYRPVFLLWMRLNSVINGLSAWGWHLLSIAKHALVAALVVLLAWKLLRDSWGAVFAALLFAFHPAQAESVSWVTVPDPLMAAAVLCSLYFYRKHLDRIAHPTATVRKKKLRTASAHHSQGPVWLLTSAIAYFAALLAKETAIVVPVIIFALAFREASIIAADSLGARIKRALLSTLPFVAATAVYLLLRVNALNGQIATATQHLPWKTVVLSWPATLWFYVKVMLWPTRSYAFADPTLIDHFSFQAVLLPLFLVLCFVASVCGVIVWIRRAAAQLPERQQADVDFPLISGTLLLFLPLLPALNLNALNPGDFLHGRYTYLPLAGLALIVASICRCAGHAKLLAISVIGLIVVVYAPLTLARQKQWKDDLTVFTVAHELAPHNAPVARNLADARVRDALLLEEEGRCNEATPVFLQVSREYPDDWYPLAGLGYCYAQSNDFVRAEDFLHRAADLSHDSGIIQQWHELRAQMGLPSLQPGSK
jgi:protein O-mannosyl-transferase